MRRPVAKATRETGARRGGGNTRGRSAESLDQVAGVYAPAGGARESSVAGRGGAKR